MQDLPFGGAVVERLRGPTMSAGRIQNGSPIALVRKAIQSFDSLNRSIV